MQRRLLAFALTCFTLAALIGRLPVEAANKTLSLAADVDAVSKKGCETKGPTGNVTKTCTAADAKEWLEDAIETRILAPLRESSKANVAAKDAPDFCAMFTAAAAGAKTNYCAKPGNCDAGVPVRCQ